MSKISKVMEITPPRGRVTTERLVSKGYSCGYCQGNGYFWGVDDYGESIQEPCPVCNGSAEVDAIINIEWKAGESNKVKE